MNQAATVSPSASAPSSSRKTAIASWVAQIVAAVILLQTLFFKLSGAPETIYIFSKIGQEPVGRYGSAVVELVAGVLLLWPRWRAVGALLGLGTMSGALFFHLTSLGIEVQDGAGNGDGGTLFGMAILTWLCCAFVLFLHRRSLPVVGSRLP
jgi:uncharacterized membrane protein YphA (DoxX/SURF4 family)